MPGRAREFQVRLDLGGVDTTALRLDIEHPLVSGRLPVPEVRFAENPPRLVWWAAQVGVSPPLGDCLGSFLKLVDAADTEIVAFAQQWGVLSLCGHGCPALHHSYLGPPCRLRTLDRSSQMLLSEHHWDGRAKRGPDLYWEPLAMWRRYARRLQALLGLAADLRAKSETSSDDWDDLFWEVDIYDDSESESDESLCSPDYWCPPSMYRQLPPKRERLSDEHYGSLSTRVTELFEEAGVAPALTWEGLVPRLALRPTDVQGSPERFCRLFSVLVCQAIAAITAKNGPLRCSWCTRPFEARGDRRPRADRGTYCSEPCRRAARREQKNASDRRRYHEKATARSRSQATPSGASGVI